MCRSSYDGYWSLTLDTRSIDQSATKTINPYIYGVNFPTSADYIKTLGVTISRWGGNAVTAYNPTGDFTNAGADWYFENRGSDNADEWLAWVHATGSDTLLTVPAYVSLYLNKGLL
jgi:GPI mannosyltransferase 3